MKKNKKLHIIITTEQIAGKLYEIFKRSKTNCYVLPKCKGFSQQANFFEFIGIAGTKVELLAFRCKERLRKFILKFLLTNYNKPNNGIMLTLEGNKKMKIENKMLVVVLNSGYGEKVADILRKHGSCGATMFDARGVGADYSSIMGIPINSNKEIIISVMPQDALKKVSKILKETFEGDPEGMVMFNLPVSGFNKLHGSVENKTIENK